MNVYFLTGTDEHGLKIQREAEKNKKDPKKFCDELSKNLNDLTKTLNLSLMTLLEQQNKDITNPLKIYGIN